MRRVVVSSVVALTLILMTATSALAISQMFAFREWADQYTGSESLMSAQDPFMPAGADWSAGPVALTMWEQPGGFIEGGNIKDQFNVGGVMKWKIRGYYSYWTNSQVSDFEPYPYLNMAPATYYKWTVYPTGSANSFQVRLCNGSNFGTCRWLLTNENMGRSDYSKVGTGAEGACANDPFCPIGYIASRSNRLLWKQDNSSTWLGYCFTHNANIADRNKYNNVYNDGGRVSSCANTDWTFNYK